MTTQAPGIFQSDIIIRTALIEALADLRRNPWLLNYVFASLRTDDLTKDVYGEREIENAKRWFARTNLPVFMVTRTDGPQLPGISIELQESVELEQTLGDVNYQSSEETEGSWPVLAGPFFPVSYDGVTGTIVLPKSVLDEIVVVPGMIVVDRTGGQYEIASVSDGGSVTITPGVTADFVGAVIKGSQPRLVTQLEGLNCRETYMIGCHVQSEPNYLTYLHSIVVFILWRYKQSLLEARGFERTVLSSSQFQRNTNFNLAEQAFSRFVSVTGYVRQFWPKLVAERPVFGGTQLSVEGANTTGPAVNEVGRADDPGALWLADRDILAAPGRSSI